MLKYITKPRDLGDVRSPIQLLKTASFVFTLTGSRYFGDAKLNSDYDFFVQKDEDVCNWLIKNGFVILGSGEGYDGIPGVSVFRKLNVDVQIRRNADEFARINQWLFDHPEAYQHLKSLGKSEKAQALWDYLKFVV